MTRVFFDEELEGVATFWRIFRRDGVALGFTSHNRDLLFGGLRHRAAPGMLPSAIRRTADLEMDAVEVRGVLAHDAISNQDMRAGRYQNARIAIGVVDWETLAHATLFHGEIGAISEEAGQFEAELHSAKAALEIDSLPRTSPACRAQFCDPSCQLSPARFTHLAQVTAIDAATGRIAVTGGPAPAALVHGTIRWLEGPQAGITMQVIGAGATGLVVDGQLDGTITAGTRIVMREGCDHTLATCSARFANGVNFQGEPYLPGNDLLARYPTGPA
jgi:uncharacterized phage protein (TIGR02218 family)